MKYLTVNAGLGFECCVRWISLNSFMRRLDLIVVSIGLGTGTPNFELGEMALEI